MQTLSMTSEPWQEVLDRLPPDLDLDTLAVSSGALKRRREVGDGTTLLRLAMARGPGGLSLNQTAAWAAMQGFARLSDPAVKYRLDRRCRFSRPCWSSNWPSGPAAARCVGPGAACAWGTARTSSSRTARAATG